MTNIKDIESLYSCGHRDDVREKPPLLCPVCHVGSLVTKRHPEQALVLSRRYDGMSPEAREYVAARGWGNR